MARRINESNSKVIEQNILKETPEDHPAEAPIAIVKELPPMERIVFRNMRDPGVALDFHYSSRSMPLVRYSLKDGKEYDLPVEVIDHLMDRKVPIYAYRRDSEGLPEMYIKSYKYYFNIQKAKRAA